MLRTTALVIAALLAMGAGYVGGKMAHPAGRMHAHNEGEMDADSEHHVPGMSSTHDQVPNRSAAPPLNGSNGSGSQHGSGSQQGSGSQGEGTAGEAESQGAHGGHSHSH